MEPVRVIYHHEAGGWWAESPDADGWSVAGGSYAEVVKLAEEGIPFALKQPAELEHWSDLSPVARLCSRHSYEALSRGGCSGTT